jgi:hypothetical protein
VDFEVGLDDGVDEDEGVQEVGVQVGEVCKVRTPNAMSNSDDRMWYVVLELVDEVEEVSSVVPPARCSSLDRFCQPWTNPFITSSIQAFKVFKEARKKG